MGVLMKQPNGLYCIYSNELNRITDINLTAMEFVSFFCRKAELDPKKILNQARNVNLELISIELLKKISKPSTKAAWKEI